MSDVGSVPLCGCESEPHTCSDVDEPTARKKRKSGTSPSSRCLAELKRRGWPAGVVERFVFFPPPGHRVDLFGFIDIVALVPGGTLGIQACAGSGHAAHRDKILEAPLARTWLSVPSNRLELWSWSKRGGRHVTRKLWTMRVEVFTLENWPAGAGAVTDPTAGYRRDDRD